MIFSVRGATAAASDVSVKSGMPNIAIKGLINLEKLVKTLKYN